MTADPSKSITYGELIGDGRFHVTLTGEHVNSVTGRAPLKPVQDLENVRQSPPRWPIWVFEASPLPLRD